MRRDQAILDAALALFSESGFAGVGVDAIGARAGVAGPAIYAHFSGKHELLATLIDQAMDRLLSLTAGAPEDPREELELLVRGHVRFALEDRALLSVYAQEARALRDDDRRRARRRQRAYVARWIDVLGRCYPDSGEADRGIAAHGTIGMIQSVVHWPSALLATPGVDETLERTALGALATLAGAPV